MTWEVSQPGGGTSLSQTAYVDCDPNDASFATVLGIAPATPIARNNRALIAFAKAGEPSAENAVWEKAMPSVYDAVKNLRLIIDWVAAAAIVGDVVWEAAFEAIAPGGLDIDTDSFAASKSVTDTTAGTAGVVTRSTIDFTNVEADGVLANDEFRLMVQRNAPAVGDTMVGDAEILRVQIVELP
jgi:hypothetical protein